VNRRNSRRHPRRHGPRRGVSHPTRGCRKRADTGRRPTNAPRPIPFSATRDDQRGGRADAVHKRTVPIISGDAPSTASRRLLLAFGDSAFIKSSCFFLPGSLPGLERRLGRLLIRQRRLSIRVSPSTSPDLAQREDQLLRLVGKYRRPDEWLSTVMRQSAGMSVSRNDDFSISASSRHWSRTPRLLGLHSAPR